MLSDKVRGNWYRLKYRKFHLKKKKKLGGLSQTGRSYPDIDCRDLFLGHIQNSTGHSPEHTSLSRPCFEQEGGGLGSSEAPSNLKYSDSMVL